MNGNFPRPTPTDAQIDSLGNRRITSFCISGEIIGNTLNAAEQAAVANGYFINLTTFIWARDLDITSWVWNVEGYSTVIGTLQNLLAIGVIGVQTDTYNLNNLPNTGAGSAIQGVFLVSCGAPSYYPANGARPELAVQSQDLTISYPIGQALRLPAGQPLSLYGSISDTTANDSIFAALHFSAFEVYQ